MKTLFFKIILVALYITSNSVIAQNDSKQFEILGKNNYSSSCFNDTITITTKPYSSTLPPPGNSIYIFKQKAELFWQHNVLNQELYSKL